jgi:hypothetical protein
MNARPRFVEPTKVLIAQRACDLSAYYARNFYKIGANSKRRELILVDSRRRIYCKRTQNWSGSELRQKSGQRTGCRGHAQFLGQSNFTGFASRFNCLFKCLCHANRVFVGAFDLTTNGHESTHKTSSLIRSFSLFVVPISVDSWLVSPRCSGSGSSRRAFLSLQHSSGTRRDD